MMTEQHYFDYTAYDYLMHKKEMELKQLGLTENQIVETLGMKGRKQHRTVVQILGKFADNTADNDGAAENFKCDYACVRPTREELAWRLLDKIETNNFDMV